MFEKIQFGPVPVVAHLKGAVIGGGIELAMATHIRVAEPTAYYALPEGQRGIYTGGGASVRLTRVIGVDRMMDMMLTGRTYSAQEGMRSACRSISSSAGEGLPRPWRWPSGSPSNVGTTNFALVQALPRIAEANRETGFMMESADGRHCAGRARRQGPPARVPRRQGRQDQATRVMPALVRSRLSGRLTITRRHRGNSP